MIKASTKSVSLLVWKNNLIPVCNVRFSLYNFNQYHVQNIISDNTTLADKKIRFNCFDQFIWYFKFNRNMYLACFSLYLVHVYSRKQNDKSAKTTNSGTSVPSKAIELIMSASCNVSCVLPLIFF